jgi:glycosyltransferase involved in cell wall biosynthesis
MRIALLHPYSWPDVRRGGERYLHDLAWYLTSQGAEVDVVVGGTPCIADVDGHRLVRIRHLRRLAVGTLTPVDTFGASAFAWLSRHRYDVVHALTPTAALAGVTSGHRTVYSVLGHPTANSLRRRRFDLQLFRAAVRRVQAPLALSHSAARAVADITGIEPSVVPPGLRTSEFPPVDQPRHGAPRVLFASDAADRRKGLDLLLAAFTLVLDTRPAARLVLGGGGDAGWAFEQVDEASRRRVQASTDHLGAGELGDLPRRYAEATVTVLPSVDEAFGLVLVESLATGTPVVACASGGPVEIVDRAEVGRLAPPGDARALAVAVLETVHLAADPATPARCAEHARRWDWDAEVGPAHLTVYDQLHRDRRRARRTASG